MSDSDLAQLIAGGALVMLVAALAIAGRTDKIAMDDGKVPVEKDQPDREVTKGTVLREKEAVGATTPMKSQRRTWLAAIIVGKDHRLSTSKVVVFAWTLAVAFGLLSLIVAVWLGDHGPWDKQRELGLQEEYLLLLGGPFAAAVLAKYQAVSQSDAKTSAPLGDTNVTQLVNDDAGDTDLGDFQYVLFNVIALAFFFGAFIGDLAGGFPALPAILTGLVLTSTGGYAAKKLVSQAAPTLMSVIPASAAPTTPVSVFGTNLTVPASVSETGEPLRAIVYFGSITGEVTAQEVVLGNDRLTVTVPALPQGATRLSVVRADGAAARGPSGADALAFTVLAP